MDDRYYIVRSSEAGVFFGRIKERRGSEVDMVDVRRIWYWAGAFTLSELAVNGTAKPNDCRFTVYVPEMTVLGICEVIPCTDKAVSSIMGVEPWQAT